MKAIGYTATFVALIVFSVLINGYALSVLWGWFFVPILGLPSITISGAIGIALIVHYLTHQEQQYDKKRELSEVMMEGFFKALFKAGFALLMGWIVSAWM